MSKGFFYPRTATGRSSLIPAPPWYYSGDLLTVEYRTDPARVAELLPAPLTLAAAGPRRGRRHLGGLAVLLREPRGAARPGALAVQGGVRRRPLQLPGPDLLALRLHLGGQGLRHRPRHPPGLPEEAGLDLADPPAPVRPGRATDRAGRSVRRDAGRRRPAHRRGDADASPANRPPTASSTVTRWPTIACCPASRRAAPDAFAELIDSGASQRRGRPGVGRRGDPATCSTRRPRKSPAWRSRRSSAATTARSASSGTAARRWPCSDAARARAPCLPRWRPWSAGSRSARAGWPRRCGPPPRPLPR